VFERVARIDLVLGAMVLAATLIALAAGRQGGRFRGLPGWAGFWIVFAGILVALSRLSPWIGFTLLGLLMFGALRAFFFVAPVRQRDRYAILASYLAVPFALWPAYLGSQDTFLAAVPVTLFLLIPVFLSIGPSERGLLDAMGRTLLGVLFFVFCIAHLGLLVHEPQPALPQLFAILVIAAELPQRLLWRSHAERGWLKMMLGMLLGAVFAVGLGFWLGPQCGLVEEDAGRAGLLVAIAATLGAQVSDAVRQDLALSASSSSLGRGAFLTRSVPAVYAAPVFFHYLNHFA